MSDQSPPPEEEVAHLSASGNQASASSLDLEAEALPSDPDEAIARLLADLGTARAEASSYLTDLQRVAADFENYRKRAQRDRDEVVLRSTQGLVAELLPVLDSFDGALAAAGGDERLADGVRSTHSLLLDVLGREGLEPIPALGLPFDPAIHEAVSGGGTGHLVVTEVLRRGYTLQGRLLRPALVSVAAEDPTEVDSP